MAPTILIVGSTGNTGKSVLHNLPKLLKLSKTMSNYRVLGLTRSLKNPAAQELAKSPLIEMAEKDWTQIDADWLREHEVVRAYIASHNQPNQFTEESAFHNALREAGVKYVVRISTIVVWVNPTSPVYYGRTHWAIENLLSQPSFKDLQWTSLQPNIFSNYCVDSAVEWIKQYRKTGKQETFKTFLAEDVGVGMIDPDDVGSVGAHLLALDDPTPHNQAKYILNGPQDFTGKQIVNLIEEVVGVKVEKVEYRDLSFLENYAELFGKNNGLVSQLKVGIAHHWRGDTSLYAFPTSKEVIELAAPKVAPTTIFKTLLED